MTTSNPTVTLTPDNTWKNDNSNPQQGSGVRSSPPPSDQTPPKEVKLDTTDLANEAARTSPAKKECRKLFVGGLPQDGKSS